MKRCFDQIFGSDSDESSDTDPGERDTAVTVPFTHALSSISASASASASSGSPDVNAIAKDTAPISAAIVDISGRGGSGGDAFAAVESVGYTSTPTAVLTDSVRTHIAPRPKIDRFLLRALRARAPAPWLLQPEGVSCVSYAMSNAPSTWMDQGVHWISIKTNAQDRSRARAKHASSSGGSYVGKWMWFVPNQRLDEAFEKVADSLERGMLGSSVKVAPPKGGPGSAFKPSPIIVYTEDFRDTEDVLRVALELRNLGANYKTIAYKPDVFTVSESVYGTLKYKTIYQLKPHAATLTRMADGKAFDMAEAMVGSGLYVDD
jgi:hypothetical protein